MAVDLIGAANLIQSLLALAVTVALGLVTVRIQRQQASIARQQAETNRLQYRLALLERRMKVFDATAKLLGIILRDARIELDQLFEFLRETRERELLFGAEIKDYLDELYSKGVELRTRDEVRRPEDFTRNTELLTWFAGQHTVATQKFLKYLDFREP
jgi:hypothetical protein